MISPYILAKSKIRQFLERNDVYPISAEEILTIIKFPEEITKEELKDLDDFINTHYLILARK